YGAERAAATGYRVLFLSMLLVGAYAAGTYLLDAAVIRTSGQFRSRALRHMARVPAAWYDTRHTGDIMSRMLTDFDHGVQNSLNMPIQEPLALLLSGIASIIVLIAFDYRIALALIAVSICSMAIVSVFVAPGRAASEKERAATGKLAERFSDIVASAAVLRVHSLHEYLFKMFSSDAAEARRCVERQGKITALQEVCGRLVTLLVYICVLGVGYLDLRRGLLKTPALIAIFQLANGPIQMFTGFGAMLVELQSTLAGASRVFEMMDVPEEPAAGGAALGIVSVDQKAPAIRMKDVSFAYPGGPQILRNISLTLAPGSKCALVGESGGGKSTLLKLLCGLYDGYEGDIYVFGRSVKHTPRDLLRETVCYVPQNPHIFIDTVLSNILYAKNGAAEEEAYTAAKQAGADAFVSQLPDGYAHMMAERGSNLSGGQIQRVALARAFLKSPPLILLDEPTASLDMESERYIVDALGSINATMIIATHRESLIRICDQAVHLDAKS
ncbi:MAG: ABC transporter ATP-binding protein/permease, partial [Clostridiales bacterium]|nr:ABC transporter ATP-binding protein/permease [Clostridiales bacterium]